MTAMATPEVTAENVLHLCESDSFPFLASAAAMELKTIDINNNIIDTPAQTIIAAMLLKRIDE